MEGREREDRNEKDISEVRTREGVGQNKTGLTLRFVSSIGGCVLSGHRRCHEPRTEQGNKGQALCSHHDAQLLPGEMREVLGWGSHSAHHSLGCHTLLHTTPQLSFLRAENLADLSVWGSCRFWKVLLEGGRCPREGGKVGCSKGGTVGLRDSWRPTGPQSSPGLLKMART